MATRRKRVRMNCITTCNRYCVNYKCRRNENHDIQTNYAYYGDFRFCEEYKPKNIKICK